MEVSTATMVYLIINFLLLTVILWFVLYKPVGNLLRDREARIASDTETARKAREEAEALKKEYEQKLVQLKRDVHDAIEKAVWQGEQEKKQIIAAAKLEAAQIVDRAEKQMANERLKAWGDLRDEVVDIAILAASKVLSRSIDDSDHKALFSKMVDEILQEEAGDD